MEADAPALDSQTPPDAGATPAPAAGPKRTRKRRAASPRRSRRVAPADPEGRELAAAAARAQLAPTPATDATPTPADANPIPAPIELSPEMLQAATDGATAILQAVGFAAALFAAPRNLDLARALRKFAKGAQLRAVAANAAPVVASLPGWPSTTLAIGGPLASYFVTPALKSASNGACKRAKAQLAARVVGDAGLRALGPGAPPAAEAGG